MSITAFVIFLYGITALAFGIYVFSIGCSGLIRKRPLVFPARPLMWFLFAMLAPTVIMLFSLLFQNHKYFNWFFVSMSVFQTAMVLLLVIILWRQMSGYMLFGVSDETFRQALTSALNELNLPYQETISKIKLTSLDTDLHAAVASWMGTAQIRINERQYLHYTKEIAGAMDQYYKRTPVKVRNFVFVIYLLLGILMLLFVLGVLGIGLWLVFRLI